MPLQKIGEVVVKGKVLTISKGTYGVENGPIAIVLTDAFGHNYAVFSVNVVSWVNDKKQPLARDQFFAKTWEENSALRDPMLATGLFEDTGKRAKVGFCEAELWQLKAA